MLYELLNYLLIGLIGIVGIALIPFLIMALLFLIDSFISLGIALRNRTRELFRKKEPYVQITTTEYLYLTEAAKLWDECTTIPDEEWEKIEGLCEVKELENEK